MPFTLAFGTESPTEFPPHLGGSHYQVFIRVQIEPERLFYKIEAEKARGDELFGRLGVAASDYFPEWLRDFAAAGIGDGECGRSCRRSTSLARNCGARCA